VEILMLKAILAIVLATCALATQANEAAVKKAVEAKLGGRLPALLKPTTLVFTRSTTTAISFIPMPSRRFSLPVT